MIVAERELIEIFDTLPVITVTNVITGNDVDYKPFYDFGGHEYLLNYLNHKGKEDIEPYPLIWLETPVILSGKTRFRGDMKFVLATTTTKDLSNRERVQTTIKSVLEPLYKNVIKALQQSGRTILLNRDNEKYSIHYNYGFNGESEVTDIWDAIKFECEVEFFNGCLKSINY